MLSCDLFLSYSTSVVCILCLFNQRCKCLEDCVRCMKVTTHANNELSSYGRNKFTHGSTLTLSLKRLSKCCWEWSIWYNRMHSFNYFSLVDLQIQTAGMQQTRSTNNAAFEKCVSKPGVCRRLHFTSSPVLFLFWKVPYGFWRHSFSFPFNFDAKLFYVTSETIDLAISTFFFGCNFLLILNLSLGKPFSFPKPNSCFYFILYFSLIFFLLKGSSSFFWSSFCSPPFLHIKIIKYRLQMEWDLLQFL